MKNQCDNIHIRMVLKIVHVTFIEFVNFTNAQHDVYQNIDNKIPKQANGIWYIEFDECYWLVVKEGNKCRLT